MVDDDLTGGDRTKIFLDFRQGGNGSGGFGLEVFVFEREGENGGDNQGQQGGKQKFNFGRSRLDGAFFLY